MEISSSYLSQRRQRISSHLAQLKRLILEGCRSESVFHGQPAQVYRQCGKPNCKCTRGGEERHGPYWIIQTYRKGKKRQTTVKRNEMHFIEMARRYQQQARNRKRIVQLQKELLEMFDEVLEKRTLWDKADYGKN